MDVQTCPLTHGACPKGWGCVMWDKELDSCRVMDALDALRQLNDDGIRVYVAGGSLNTYEQN